MKETTVDVLIVGGGPSGMIGALCLARHGVSTLIVERGEGIQVHPKAHEVNARSIEILHGLGIGYDQLAAEASPHEDGSRILFCDTIGKEFGCVDLTTGPGADKYRRHLAAPFPYLNLSQVELEKVLFAHLLESPHAKILYSHQWESLAQEGEGVTSHVTDRVTGETLTVRSRYVLCADGAASRCRKALGIAMDGPEKIRDYVNAYFEADLSKVVTTRGKLYFILCPAAAGSVFIAHHVERRWVFHTPVMTPHEKIEDYTEEVMRARILAALGRSDVDIRIKSMSSWRMTAQVAARFREGRAFLVGDAAHRFPPTGGLGMNTGIGDAHNLAWKIAAVLKGRAPDSLLDSYESERRPIAKTNCEESRTNLERMAEIAWAFGVDPAAIDKMNKRMQSGPITVLPASGRRWVRRQIDRLGAGVLARYDKDPVLRERVLAAIAAQRSHFDRIGLDVGYTYEEGALLPDSTPPVTVENPVSEYRPSTRPGARFPHFWLDAKRKTRSSHELIDYRLSTLLVGDAVEWVETEAGTLDEAADQLGVRIMSFDRAGVPLAYRGALQTLCELDADGALLIRPDGHVAWRRGSGVSLSCPLVVSILAEAYR